MTPSDWIALGALAVAAASIVFGYLTNKANIKARRAEIAMEKSIEAYCEIVEKIITLRRATVSKLFISKDKQSAYKASLDCTDAINKYRFLLPEAIGNDLSKQAAWISHFIWKETDFTDEDHKRLEKEIASIEAIINRMQKHLGVETKEG